MGLMEKIFGDLNAKEVKKVEKIVDHKKYYPGWHMNKKYWYTIILDGSISLKDIYKCIDESYQMTK